MSIDPSDSQAEEKTPSLEHSRLEEEKKDKGQGRNSSFKSMMRTGLVVIVVILLFAVLYRKLVAI